MPIVAADIKRRLSTQTGAAGNSTASTPAESIGKYMSTTAYTTATLANLFASITAAEAAAGKTVYRCIFLYNSHGSLTWQAPLLWLVSQVAGGGDITVGLDPAGAQTYNQAGTQAAVPASDIVAPTGVTFSNPTSEGDALSVGDLAINKCIAVWFKLVVAADAAAVSLDDVIYTVKGTTDP